eukprot:gnl/Dysnectes_brevis/2750_a3345_867.p1 GENE.gnl/Dysnectes_brevis/2750_a3345_867~~gnl/Dysnectes_brevis/2750_a3345_867.p1  ORF type:complete len:327 (-),score=51.60 gnl/Dysnectes_brevis/2750_a3345_867:36-1016(-)
MAKHKNKDLKRSELLSLLHKTQKELELLEPNALKNAVTIPDPSRSRLEIWTEPSFVALGESVDVFFDGDLVPSAPEVPQLISLPPTVEVTTSRGQSVSISNGKGSWVPQHSGSTTLTVELHGMTASTVVEVSRRTRARPRPQAHCPQDMHCCICKEPAISPMCINCDELHLVCAICAGQVPPPSTCPICEKGGLQLRAPIRLVLNALRKTQVICSICDRPVSILGYLDHSRECRDPSLPCPYCGEHVKSEQKDAHRSSCGRPCECGRRVGPSQSAEHCLVRCELCGRMLRKCGIRQHLHDPTLTKVHVSALLRKLGKKSSLESIIK